MGTSIPAIVGSRPGDIGRSVYYRKDVLFRTVKDLAGKVEEGGRYKVDEAAYQGEE